MPLFRVAFDLDLLRSRAFGWRIAALGAFRRIAVNLDKHGVVNVGAERAFNGFK